MKTIETNAVVGLFRTMETLTSQPHKNWRAIHLKFSGTPERHNHALYSVFIVKAVKDMLSDHEGHIYFCEDGDIVILFQGLLKPVMEKLSNHFGDFEDAEHADESLFTIFDLNTEWNDFYNLCEDKYVLAVANSEAVRTQAIIYRTHPAEHRKPQRRFVTA